MLKRIYNNISYTRISKRSTTKIKKE